MNKEVRDIVLLLLIGVALILAYVLFIGQLEVVLDSLVVETLHVTVATHVAEKGETSA